MRKLIKDNHFESGWTLAGRPNVFFFKKTKQDQPKRVFAEDERGSLSSSFVIFFLHSETLRNSKCSEESL